MTRRFTDGEIVAAIRAAASEGASLSRASIGRRLGGGSSKRISAILKEYIAGAYDKPVQSGSAGPLRPEAVGGVHPVRGALEPLDPVVSLSARGPDTRISDLQREARALEILLESERQARRQDASRHARTVEALQRELAVFRSQAERKTKP